MKNLRYVDSNWYKTTEGDTCLQQLQNQMHRSRKQFGLLERPNFPPGTLEMSYKINVIGKAGTGKTKIISMISGVENSSGVYTETIGIHVKDVYWPTKINNKVTLFKIQFWESGEHFSRKYSYISPECCEKADVIAVIINRGDHSTLNYAENKLDSTDGEAVIVGFVVDSEHEEQISDHELDKLQRNRKLFLFYLPPNAMNTKFLAPFFSSLCDFLYSLKKSATIIHADL